MNTILDKIANVKKVEVAQAKIAKPLSQLATKDMEPPRDFVAALSRKIPGIIAEIKKASPSKGIIRPDFNVADIAKIYSDHGASCLSVLSDQQFFQGSPEYIAEAKKHSPCPILRKDFIIDAYQIHESRALGADCILLITALLEDAELLDFCQQAQELGMAVLVESHTREELERSLRLPTPLIGINNRSLHTFETRQTTSIELAGIIPNDRLIISESGINERKDILRLQEHGINHFLIGESLMRSNDIGHKLDELLGLALDKDGVN